MFNITVTFCTILSIEDIYIPLQVLNTRVDFLLHRCRLTLPQFAVIIYVYERQLRSYLKNL